MYIFGVVDTFKYIMHDENPKVEFTLYALYKMGEIIQPHDDGIYNRKAITKFAKYLSELEAKFLNTVLLGRRNQPSYGPGSSRFTALVQPP